MLHIKLMCGAGAASVTYGESTRRQSFVRMTPGVRLRTNKMGSVARLGRQLLRVGRAQGTRKVQVMASLCQENERGGSTRVWFLILCVPA